MNDQDLDNVLKTLNVDECIRFFSKMDEKQRKALSERALLWHTVSVGCNLNHPEMSWWTNWLNRVRAEAPKRVQKMFAQQDEARKLASQLPKEAQERQAIKASAIAVFSTCSFTEVKKHDAIPEPGAAYKLVTDRKPRWAQQFATLMLKEKPELYFETFRRLEKENTIQLEHDSTYLAGMSLGLDRDGMLDTLLDDPPLIDEIERMLDDHTAMSAMLSQGPTWNDGKFLLIGSAGMRWKDAICKLISQGKISRDRVLKSVMSTLTRLALENSDGSASIGSAWFVEMHRALELEVEEHLLLFPDYCTALRSRSDWALRWAIGQVSALSNLRQFPLDDACVAMAEVFLTKGKENSQMAIDCLKAIAKENELMHPSVALCAAEALSHTSSDIQKQAIMLVEKFGDKKNVELVDRLSQQMGYVAVLNKERLAKWLPADSQTNPDDTDQASASNVVQLSSARGAKDQALSAATQADDFNDQIASLKGAIQDVPEIWLKVANIQSGFDAFEGKAIDLESVEFDGTEIPRLSDEKRLKPIQDLDELVFLMARYGQGRDANSIDADDLELIMDGISRLCCQRPADFEQRTASVRLLIFDAYDVLRMCIDAWLEKNNRFECFGTHPIDKLLASRGVVAARRIRKRISLPLLAAPTHRGGWIDPIALVQRVVEGVHLGSPKDQSNNGRLDQPQKEQPLLNLQSLSQSIQQFMVDKLNVLKEALPTGLGQSIPDQQSGHIENPPSEPKTTFKWADVQTNDGNIAEQSIALLRLAPDRREQALRMLEIANVKQCEFIDALRYALGAHDVKIGFTAQLWVAAARSRAPFQDDPKIEERFPGLGPDGGTSARYTLSLKRFEPPSGTQYYYSKPLIVLNVEPKPALQASTSVATHSMHLASKSSSCRYAEWSATIWPLCLEPIFAKGAEQLANIYSTDYSSGKDSFLQPLYDGDIPAKSNAVLCIALGLTSKHQDTNGAAIEALIQSVDDGRINGRKLGDVLYQLFSAKATRDDDTPLVTLQRWTKALRTVAQASQYHARVVALALEQLLQGDPFNAPKDLHSALELLLELLGQEQQVLTLESARQYLSGLKTSGKTQLLTKQLLALKPGPMSKQKLQEAFLYALQRRVDRVQRWQSKAGPTVALS